MARTRMIIIHHHLRLYFCFFSPGRKCTLSLLLDEPCDWILQPHHILELYLDDPSSPCSPLNTSSQKPAMLSTFAPSSGRRGLRGAGHAESSSKKPSLYSLSISSQASSSSFASGDTATRMSIATSFSLASSSKDHMDKFPSIVGGAAAQLHPTPSRATSQKSIASSSKLSPIEIFQLRLKEGRNAHHDAVEDKERVRVVGRGGQGSRPRALPVSSTPTGDQPPREILRSPSAHSESDDKKLATRVTPLHPVPLPIPQVSQSPVVYRPGGRGGAGSRPRKVKQPSEVKEKERKFPWKGKGKAKEDLSSALTRTDTIGTTASSIEFSPVLARAHQRPVNDPFSEIPANKLLPPAPPLPASSNKLARTLGADFRFPQIVESSGPQSADLAKARKIARRSSLSVFSLSSFSAASVDSAGELGASGSAQKTKRRRSSDAIIPSSSHNSQATSAASTPHREVWDIGDHRAAAHLRLTRKDSAASSIPYQYPAPPRPPPAFPDEPEYADDGQSEIMSFDDTSIDTHSHMRSETLSSTGDFAFLPQFENDDLGEEYNMDLARTPTALRSLSPYPRCDTPFAFDEKPPFSTASLVVVPTWKLPADPHAAVVRNEVAQGWSGEWNRANMRDVISALRDLKL
ncbi:hypothetical protein B0H10DRAFT_2103800 [Mycena sp. CBHHK59/15]|nr:hypothetical protein B0H10DRAFT_2103800 [Mycena sp. CBHHK59/15]